MPHRPDKIGIFLKKYMFIDISNMFIFECLSVCLILSYCQSIIYLDIPEELTSLSFKMKRHLHVDLDMNYR